RPHAQVHELSAGRFAPPASALGFRLLASGTSRSPQPKAISPRPGARAADPGEFVMNKEMIVSSNGHETMVAILEDDLVAEVFVERERSRGVAGNVYKGRVSKVMPGLQSSFIDIGLERDGFLFVAEVIDTLEEFERLAGEDEDEAKTDVPAQAPESHGDPH